jgi:hypothetical protein
MGRGKGKDTTGKQGSSFSTIREGKVIGSGRTNEPIVEQFQLPEHPATVGCSVSVGFNTDYGKEKLEVCTWMSVPCDTTEEDLHAKWEVCAEYATDKAHEILDSATERYFPHLLEEED